MVFIRESLVVGVSYVGTLRRGRSLPQSAREVRRLIAEDGRMNVMPQFRRQMHNKKGNMQWQVTKGGYSHCRSHGMSDGLNKQSNRSLANTIFSCWLTQELGGYQMVTSFEVWAVESDRTLPRGNQGFFRTFGAA
ncbi:hypothetical protein [Bradyrhizobium sp. USDA 4506]